VHFLLKTIISAVLIVAISELSKRSATVGGLIASLPITPILAFCGSIMILKALIRSVPYQGNFLDGYSFTNIFCSFTITAQKSSFFCYCNGYGLPRYNAGICGDVLAHKQVRNFYNF
jgi:hypothetical protein